MRITFVTDGGWPRVREVYWRIFRRWETEICCRCGRPVARWNGSWWNADDDLWQRVIGDPYTVRCMHCFIEAADAKGLMVYWKPILESVRTTRGWEPASEAPAMQREQEHG